MIASFPYSRHPFSRCLYNLIVTSSVLSLVLFGMGYSQAFAQEPTQTPAPFDPTETQHGYSDFDSMPTVPAETSSNNLPYYDSSHPPASIDEKPKGLFQELILAEDVDEDLEHRRGHVYIPVRPTQQFHQDNLAVYVVFRVFKHYTSYQVFGQLYPQHTPDSPKPDMLDEDIVYLATEDESGYLKLFAPDGGWQPGAYQIHIFVGFEANSVSRMGTLHFTIVPS